MKAIGLLDLNPPTDFHLPDSTAAQADEDPLEEGDPREFHRDYLGGEDPNR